MIAGAHSSPDVEEPLSAPEQVDISAAALQQAEAWLIANASDRYRASVMRQGRLVARWHHGVEPDARLPIASAAKSVFSCILGIAVAEGAIRSVDAQVADYYPEMLQVPEGCGPKPGRYAFEKDRTITFRHLISNTSGYMKPGEQPGHVFHYQTYGMNILTHAIAKIYGLYDVRDPEGCAGFKALVDDRLRTPMGGQWGYYQGNFDLHEDALISIFGYYDGMKASLTDLEKLGLLWLQGGRWADRQLVPSSWLDEATRVAPDIVNHCPPEDRKYGYGFWTNEYGLLWPDLPRDSFAAAGAGSHLVWVCPGLELVVVQSPGLYRDIQDEGHGLLARVVAACG